MTAVDHAELKRLADALRVSWSDRGWTPAKKVDGLLKEARQAADGLDALLSEIEGLKAERSKTERDYTELRDSYDAVVSKLTIERRYSAELRSQLTALRPQTAESGK